MCPILLTDRLLQTEAAMNGGGGEVGGGAGGVESDCRDSLTRSQYDTTARAGKRKGSEWEILGNLEKGVSYTIKPKRYEGHLFKRRKWPLKGWRKRFFLIEQGFFTYAKTAFDISRGRTLGRFNIGEAVISANYSDMRIDIDAEENVHHVRLEGMEQFALFLEQLQQHRLFVQHQVHCSPASQVEESPPSLGLPPGHRNSLVRPRPGRTVGTAAALAELAAHDEWLQSGLGGVTAQLASLQDCLAKLEGGEQSGYGVRKLFHLRKKKSGGGSVRVADRMSPVEGGEADGAEQRGLAGAATLSSSNPSLAGLGRERPTSFPGAGGVTAQPAGAREEALALLAEVQAELTGLQQQCGPRREQLRQMLESDSRGSSLQPNLAVTASLRQALKIAQEQNQILRTKLTRIHSDSDLADLPTVPTPSDHPTLHRGMNNTLSYSSFEFFDARDYVENGEETDDEEGEEGEESDESRSEEGDAALFQEAELPPVEEKRIVAAPGTGTLTGRRSELPVPRADTEGINLWNLLCKNIGKDLSKISMPVTLNEPLSTLQRLCEELEYSELLDKAAAAGSPLERMVWVAVFSISAYSSTRASHKPFNPLLGETFECERADRGFRYLAEQVSHHPPVSCVAATGEQGWAWQQALRIRSKFWGKSMEFQPEGEVQLQLGGGEEYKWNKVTSCIHNLLGQERWVDLYGESIITCRATGLTARIQYVKASYWSNKRHELVGSVTDREGAVLQTLFGRWSEAVYIGKAPSARCVWRPGALPEEADLFYGFSRLATELNEVL